MKKCIPQGFTLIELLVVIAIIVILIGLAFPALSPAMQRARSATCMSNLRQIGAAVGLYVGDREGFLPPVKTADNASPAHHWCQFLAPYLGVSQGVAQAINPLPRGWPAGSKLADNWWKPFERGNPIWGCPEWKGRDTSWNIPPVGPVSVSSPGYGMNRKLKHPDNTSTMFSQEVLSFSEITFAKKRALIMDARDWHVEGDFDPNNGFYGFNAGIPGSPTRHGRTANYLMCDLSVRALPFTNAFRYLSNPGHPSLLN